MPIALYSRTQTQRVGLIDYGQVKRLTPEIRVAFAKLILALYRDDRDEVVRIMWEVCV